PVATRHDSRGTARSDYGYLVKVCGKNDFPKTERCELNGNDRERLYLRSALSRVISASLSVSSVLISGKVLFVSKLKRICVYCGSSVGARPASKEAAHRLGELMAARGIGLVFGGGCIGLMGVIADAVLGKGGEAIGVIPQSLVRREIGHGGVTKLHVVETMHQRKALMADLSDAFIALPGGYGTLEE